MIIHINPNPAKNKTTDGNISKNVIMIPTPLISFYHENENRLTILNTLTVVDIFVCLSKIIKGYDNAIGK